ncbi:hypothetical protein RUND412_007373 [Rhizina undulata]
MAQYTGASLIKIGLDLKSKLFLSPRETLFNLLLRDDINTKPVLVTEKAADTGETSPSASDSDSIFDVLEQFHDSSYESAEEEESPLIGDNGIKAMNDAFEAVWGAPLRSWANEDVPENEPEAKPEAKPEDLPGPTCHHAALTRKNLEQAWARAMISRHTPPAESLYSATLRKEALKRLQPGVGWRYDQVGGWECVDPRLVYPPGVKGLRVCARPEWLQRSLLRISESADPPEVGARG